MPTVFDEEPNPFTLMLFLTPKRILFYNCLPKVGSACIHIEMKRALVDAGLVSARRF